MSTGNIRLSHKIISAKSAKLTFFLNFCGYKSQIIKIIIRRAPGPYGASPTQPYKCGQYVKIKTALVLTLTLTLNILTAFIRLGRARPEGAGCPP
jgi:hypothetical protein